MTGGSYVGSIGDGYTKATGRSQETFIHYTIQQERWKNTFLPYHSWERNRIRAAPTVVVETM